MTEKKYQFGVEQIEFFRQVFTKDGQKSSPDKVRAVKESGVPENKEAKNKEAVQSRVGYLDSFIKNYAAIVA